MDEGTGEEIYSKMSENWRKIRNISGFGLFSVGVFTLLCAGCDYLGYSQGILTQDRAQLLDTYRAVISQIVCCIAPMAGVGVGAVVSSEIYRRRFGKMAREVSKSESTKVLTGN